MIRASRPAEAVQILSTIPPLDSDYYSAQTLLGFLFLQRSALPQAESAFRNVLNGQADNAQARLGLGIALLRSGSADQAAIDRKEPRGIGILFRGAASQSTAS